MLIELDKLEHLMPDHSDPLCILSKTIRKNVWPKSHEKQLAAVLNACNRVFSVLVNALGNQIEILEMYVEYLQKHSYSYSIYDLKNYYETVKAHIQVYRTQELVKEHWHQLNPYFRKEYAQEELLEKDLTEILDDFYSNIIKICPDEFLISLEYSPFERLLRGRRNCWKKKEDLAAPSIEVAVEKHIINRWNPPEKRYLYLVAGDGTDNDIETVCREMRIKDGEMLTVAEFEYNAVNPSAKIVDMDYEKITHRDIFAHAEAFEKQQVHDIISQLCFDSKISEQEIKRRIKLKEHETRKESAILAGRLLLKEICDAIFVPLDEIEDNDLTEKDKCYKAFHVLAEFFENKGFAGICFPSTRMKLVGKSGKNLVLFNADSATAIESTFNTFMKE